MWLNHPVKNVEAGETDSIRCIHTSRIPYERCKMMHIEWKLLSHGPLLHHHPWPKYIAAGYLYCPHVAHGLSNSRKTWRGRDYDTGAWNSLRALQCLQGWRHCRSQQGQDRAWGLQTHLLPAPKKGTETHHWQEISLRQKNSEHFSATSTLKTWIHSDSQVIFVHRIPTFSHGPGHHPVHHNDNQVRKHPGPPQHRCATNQVDSAPCGENCGNEPGHATLPCITPPHM